MYYFIFSSVYHYREMIIPCLLHLLNPIILFFFLFQLNDVYAERYRYVKDVIIMIDDNFSPFYLILHQDEGFLTVP